MAHERTVRVGNAHLYVREVGQGPPIIVLHGGPDFDHRYFLPDLDRLADAYRLIYYDQRGRGGSATGVRPEEVTIRSEVADLEAVRKHVGLESTALLGHSWGAVLALEYALRHPERVSHLILMNPAPVSREDFLVLRREAEQNAGVVVEKKAQAATPAYRRGDPDAVTAYYRIHFEPAVRRKEDLERLLPNLVEGFTTEGILKARAIEDRLMTETWLQEGYDLLPRLGGLRMPALVIRGDQDFIPASCAEHIARALPNATHVTVEACGHFVFLERPAETRRALETHLDRRPR